MAGSNSMHVSITPVLDYGPLLDQLGLPKIVAKMLHEVNWGTMGTSSNDRLIREAREALLEAINGR